MSSLAKSVVVHRASERGVADHGWLKARHSFSFGSYFNPEKMGFGTLRVINDDIIAAGKGFPTHPHRNMEIITVPLTGSLTHRDSEGNEGTIKAGEIQVMSAGTGIKHSEYNSSSEELNLLQIWIIPKSENTKPRYAQSQFDWEKSKFTTLVSPEEGNGIVINQDAFINLLNLGEGESVIYRKHIGNNVTYVYLIDGEGTFGETDVSERDAVGFPPSVKAIEIRADSKIKVLVFEVPL
jgi:redox-sensitive bicupin YhaK (pirin superfamily)